MRRELRLMADQQPLGWVDDSRTPPLDPVAADVLSGPIRDVGEAQAVRNVLRDGWSNGYLYFAEPSR